MRAPFAIVAIGGGAHARPLLLLRFVLLSIAYALLLAILACVAIFLRALGINIHTVRPLSSLVSACGRVASSRRNLARQLRLR